MRKKIGGIKPPPTAPEDIITARIQTALNRLSFEVFRVVQSDDEPFDDEPPEDWNGVQ